MRHNSNKLLLAADRPQDAKRTLGASVYCHKQDYWQECKEHLQKRIPASLYQTMIEPLYARLPSTSDSSPLELFAPNQEIAKRISQRYLPMIQDFLEGTPFKGQVSLAAQPKGEGFSQNKNKLEKKREIWQQQRAPLP